MNFANRSWEIGSVLTMISGWRIWFSIHSAVRRCVTPAKSGQVTFLPNAWQAEQPLSLNSCSPRFEAASSSPPSNARGPPSYLDTASSFRSPVAGADAGGVVLADALPESDVPLLVLFPPHPAAMHRSTASAAYPTGFLMISSFLSGGRRGRLGSVAGNRPRADPRDPASRAGGARAPPGRRPNVPLS